MCARLDHVGAPCPEAVSHVDPNSFESLVSMGSGVATLAIVFKVNIPPTTSSSLFSNSQILRDVSEKKREEW